MNKLINHYAKWLNDHPQLKQWGWFVVLWIGGLVAALSIAYPIKLLIKLL